MEYWELCDLLKSISISCDETIQAITKTSSNAEKANELQSALSDLQIFLLREREENLRLSSLNDELRIRDWENKRALKVLLPLSGITHQDLLNILNSGSCEMAETPDIDNIRDISSWSSSDALKLQVRSLTTQLENLRTLYKNEVDVLLKDRESVVEERLIESRNFRNQNSYIVDHLKEVQQVACRFAEKLIDQTVDKHEEEVQWVQCKDQLEEELKLARKRISNIQSNSEPARINHLANQDSGNKLPDISMRKMKQLELELKKWKNDANANETRWKSKLNKLMENLNVMKRRYSDLDRRRRLEAEGFQTDIKCLRNRVNFLEESLIKAKAAVVKSKHIGDQNDLKVPTQTTLLRAQALERELSSTLIKILKMKEP